MATCELPHPGFFYFNQFWGLISMLLDVFSIVRWFFQAASILCWLSDQSSRCMYMYIYIDIYKWQFSFHETPGTDSANNIFVIPAHGTITPQKKFKIKEPGNLGNKLVVLS